MAAPMREPTFWILTALTAAPLHGYGIIQQAGRLSDGRVHLQAGTLYAALDRLVAEGLVEPDREEMVDGRNRRYYRLTDDGAAALDAEAARLRASADAATSQLRTRRTFGLGTAQIRIS
jgi:PadR family transcriptional regulator, regulatory protein PadR